jgi:hypothetical protein
MENVLFTVIAFLGFIVLFTLAVRYGTMAAGSMMGSKIHASHHAMEHILDTEKIPPEWLEPAPREPAQLVKWQQRQKRRSRQKLNQLITYAENTPAFADAGSRIYVLDELARIQNEWAERDFAEITDTPPLP